MGEICDIVSGSTPRTSDPENWDGPIPWITPDDLSGYVGKFIGGGRRSLTEKGYRSCSAQLVPVGTVLYTSRAPIGYVAIAARPLCTNQGFKSFVPPDGVLSDYIFWYLKYATPEIRKMGSGTTFLEISKRRAASISAPIAPTAEQRRIVAAIEEQFSRIDAGVQTLQRVRRNLQRMRAAVLQAALEGWLARQDPNDEPADVLTKRIAEEHGSRWERGDVPGSGAKIPLRAKYRGLTHPSSSPPYELPKGWAWVTWGQVGFSQNGRLFPSAEYDSSGVRLLRPGNLHVSGRIEWAADRTEYLAERWATEFPNFIVGPNEIVMNLTAQSLRDEFLGRVCMTRSEDRCLLNQRIARLTPVLVSPRYMFWVFKSPLFRRFVSGLNTGSLIQHMFTSQLSSFMFPLPPLPEQDRVVNAVERYVTLVDQLDRTITTTMERSASLRQCILRAAFEGRLVRQHPSDEPAPTLLEHVAVTRASVAHPERTRRARRSH
jgi:type I restriction enzyme S subunit